MDPTYQSTLIWGTAETGKLGGLPHGPGGHNALGKLVLDPQFRLKIGLCLFYIQDT